VTEGRRIDGAMPVAFRYTPGIGAGAFLEGLRARELRASRCARCDVTYLPARAFCERCLAALETDATCGPEGSVESSTLLHVDVDGGALPAPEAFVLVRLDGADTVMLLRWLGEGTPAIGARAAIAWGEDRVGSILDVDGAVPAGS
jgi:uncharacterized OB-fold protein